MQIRNQPIAHPYDPNALNASTTVQKSELVGTAFSKLIRSMNAPLHAKQEDLVPSEEVQAAWSPQAIYQSMAMQVPSPTSTSRTVRGICWTDQTLAVFIGNGGEIPIDTEKTINWDSQGDQEITEAQIAELRMKYNLDHLSAQDYYNLLSDLTNMGVLSAEDCAGMHLASGSSGITFQPFAVGGEAGLFDGNLVQHLRVIHSIKCCKTGIGLIRRNTIRSICLVRKRKRNIEPIWSWISGPEKICWRFSRG